jgi:AmiR/NasT family two-component response regulator
MAALASLLHGPRTALAVFRADSARAFACDVLRAAGVVSVLPAAEASDCTAQDVDVIVTDWPDDESLDEHIAHLRARGNGARRDTPVVMLTARESRADLEAARRAGVAAYVVAPVSPVMLKHRLARLVGGNHQAAHA